MPNPGERRIVLYVRDGCHLCEDAGVLLDDMIGQDSYTSIDIDTDDALLVRYAHRIPVLSVDGEDRLELIFTAPDLREALDR
jgi:CBS domain-containing protein